MTYDCATIQVPQDWKNKNNGKTFDIAMLRAHSAQQSNKIGSLIVNPGGPGGSGVELAVYLSSELPQEILDRFDIVGFDPRGVGRSSPVKCFTSQDLDQSFGLDPDPQSQADFDAVVALDTKMANECQAKYGDTLSLFSTEQAARDMDAVRAAVGDPKINYLGFSYGTLLGATYAQLFPKNIRAFVLDGAVDPTQKPVDAAEGQAAGFEHAYDEFSAWCKQNTVTCPITGGDARATAMSLMSQGRTNPAVNADGRKATPGWVLTGISAALYDQSAWPILGRALATLAQGDAKLMFQLADSYADRNSDGTYGNMFDIFNAVECDDDNSGETVDLARQLQSQWRAKYPLFGTSLALGVISCAVWTAKRDPYPTGKAVGAPPIVVVGTTNDPATPYAQTAKLSDMLGVGHVLTWNGEGHTAYPKTTCIRAAVDAYLIKGDVPATGTTCPAK
jgi:pimeloyl-ACP methyl ester carboxylesterase